MSTKCLELHHLSLSQESPDRDIADLTYNYVRIRYNLYDCCDQYPVEVNGLLFP